MFTELDKSCSKPFTWSSVSNIGWQLRVLADTVEVTKLCFVFAEPNSITASHLREAATTAAAATSHDSSGPSARLLQAKCSWPTESNPGQFWRTEHQGTTGTVDYSVTNGEADERFRQGVHCLCEVVVTCSLLKVAEVTIYKWKLVNSFNTNTFILCFVNRVSLYNFVNKANFV